MFSTLEFIFMFLCTVLNVSAYYRLLSHKLEYRFSPQTHIPAYLIILVDIVYTVILSSSFIIGTVKLSTNLAIALSLIVLYIISFLALFLLGKITRKSEELMNTSLRLQQMEIEHKQTQDMAILVDDLRALRHDMNNHMSILQGLLSMKEYEDASAYLSGIVEELSPANSLVFPDNKVLSVLLNSKIEKARQLGITFETEILTSSTPFSDLDLCAVIGNVIENAIEASSKHAKPYIFFSIQKSNHTFLLQCDNTYTVAPIFQKGNPVTTKAEKRHHGIGTKNIRSIVEACHGTCSFDADDLFHVNISVPL